MKWENLYSSAISEPLPIVVSVRTTSAIVISQDCDCSREVDLSLCEIRKIQLVDGSFKDPKETPDWWQRQIIKQQRSNPKWFYLPQSDDVGIPWRAAVDFATIIRIPRGDLKEYAPTLRKARLNETAYQHFKERLSNYFRRFAASDWFALSKEEFRAYSEKLPDSEKVTPFDWQVEG
ncbi:MAG: hypothetical protein K2X81_28300 [Candidatus Obscuribacterales bacterium]|nr:hypothetical protein [Candidatus Obscuribacterales bacterium]